MGWRGFGRAGRDLLQNLSGGHAAQLDGRVVAEEAVRRRGRHRRKALGVRGHDDRAAEAQVVLERVADVGHLALAGPAANLHMVASPASDVPTDPRIASAAHAYLPRQFGALGEAGGTERVALGDQAAGRVDDKLAAVGVVAAVDELAGLALGAQAQVLVREQLRDKDSNGWAQRSACVVRRNPDHAGVPRWRRSSRAVRRPARRSA